MVEIAADALSQPAASSWPLVQATLGATLAWVIALHLAGHPDPFFAPMSAVVALNAPRGERGLQAVRLLAGIVLGILVGEAVVVLLGAAYAGVALASFLAMAIAHAAGGARIAVIQAGGSAILTVAVAGGEAGLERLLDALIGGGVAIVFSQVVFSPEPVALLRRAEADALREMAEALDLTAKTLGTVGLEHGELPLDALRQLRDRLAELGRLRKASGNVARHSAMWRSQAEPLVRERETAGQLDLLGGACVMLVRAAFAVDPAKRSRFTSAVQALAQVLKGLAQAPGDRDTRQSAADQALAVARRFARIDAAGDTNTALLTLMLRVVATDVIVFTGIDAAQAEAAIGRHEELNVPSPPSAPRAPFGLDRWGGRRSERESARELPGGAAQRADDHLED